MAQSLQSLPPELLFRIFSDASLDLIDLARTSLACPSLAPVTRLAAERHAQKRIISTVLQDVPEDVLCVLASNDAGTSGWSSLTAKADLQPLTRKYWDSFGDRDLDAGIQELLPLVRLFASLAAYVYRINEGFPETLKGSLPCGAGPHQLLLLLHALLYSLIRCLARRSRHSAGKAREISEYSALLNLPEDGVLESAELEHRMRQECMELKAALMMVDPLQSHLLEGSAIHCRCKGRTHASWYLLCWHHLVVRYRRFLIPSDIDHVAFRTIYYAVPAFPANEGSSLTAAATTSSSENNGSATDRFLPSSANPWSLSLPGFFPSTSGTSLPGPHGPPLLNPDSLLFSLTPSPTAEQSKAWYGLSEFALPAGAARLWAGWIGYGWAEGGLHWHDRAQRKAENRLGKLASEHWEDQDHGKHSVDEQSSMLPVERVLLAHARWRARVLLLEKDTLLEGLQAFDQQTLSQRRQPEPSLMTRQKMMLLSQQSAFDWHFLSRALQIQQWALRGWANAGGQEAGGAGSLYDEGGRIPGQVARTSPFEIILAPRVTKTFRPGSWTERLGGILSSSISPITALLATSARSDEQASAMRTARGIEVAERWRRAWEAVEEPLRPCLAFDAAGEEEDAPLDPSSASPEDKVADAWRRAESQQSRVLSALGDLYGGLYPRHRGGQLDVSALCNEIPDLTNCGDVVDTHPAAGGPASPLSRAGPSAHMLRAHARVPQILSPLVATIKTAAIVALLAWLAQVIVAMMR